MKNLTVAFFFHDADRFSGATMALLDLIDWYIENIRTMKVITVFPVSEGTAIDYLKEKRVIIISSHYDQITRSIYESKIKNIERLPKRMYRLLRNMCWNKLITYNYLKKMNVDVIYSNTSVILDPWWVAKRLKKPIIAHFREFCEEDYEITPWFGRRKFYKIVNRYDEIVCISKSIYDKYKEHIIESKMSIIYDDLSKKYRNYKEKDISNGFNILIAGTITPGKGQLLALNRLKNMLSEKKDIHLYIAGGIRDNDYYNSLKKYIDDNNLKDNVEILGQVKDMNSLRDKMHVGIVSSEREGFGRVTIEGMLSGLIMLGRNSGGTAELISNNSNGFIINYNMDDLEKTVLYVYTHYHELESLRNNAYTYGESFTNGNCAKTLLDHMYKLKYSNKIK